MTSAFRKGMVPFSPGENRCRPRVVFRPLLSSALLISTIAVGGLLCPIALIASSEAGDEPAEVAGGEGPGDDAVIDPLSVNAACYVCHTTFVFEELSKIHFREKVTCIECHGLSAGHANDEDIGATPPDVTFRRKQVDKMCRECHEKHRAAPGMVIARWLERELAKTDVVCTDCHGTHQIEQAADFEDPHVGQNPGEDAIGKASSKQ